jgi:hypothetical protein
MVVSRIYDYPALSLVYTLAELRNMNLGNYISKVTRSVQDAGDGKLIVTVHYEYGARDSYYHTWTFEIDTNKLQVTKITWHEKLEDRGG